MGANIDMDVAVGRNLEEAFGIVREARAYDYGHSGYTGTFAEKHGAKTVGVKLPPRVSHNDFENMLERYQEWKDHGYWWDRVLVKEGESPWQHEYRKVKRRRDPRPKSMQTTVWDRAISSFLDIADDKWGPAAAVELNDKDRLATIKQQRRDWLGKQGIRAWFIYGWCSS